MQEKGKKPEKMRVKDALKKGIIKLPWHAYWLAIETKWFLDLGANKEKFRVRQHLKDERSHYAIDTWDIEYVFPFGWKELEGIADRGNFDLTQHEKHSEQELRVFDDESKKKILPEVVAEPSLGVERAFLVFLFDAYSYDKKRKNVVLKLSPKIAPIKAAVLPIVKNEEMIKIAKDIESELRKEWNVKYDESGSIGRRYSRNDEIGVPIAIAIDEQTLNDNTVTLRDRDTTEQVRVPISQIKETIRKVINGENLLKLGPVVKTRVK
jgi:glycyl-tRNA synthetase